MKNNNNDIKNRVDWKFNDMKINFHDAVMENDLENWTISKYSPIKFGTNKNIFSFSTTSAIFPEIFPTQILCVDAFILLFKLEIRNDSRRAQFFFVYSI